MEVLRWEKKNKIKSEKNIKRTREVGVVVGEVMRERSERTMGVDRERRKDEEEEKMKPCQDDKGALEWEQCLRGDEEEWALPFEWSRWRRDQSSSR